ncbi:MAG: ABC transporter ATP-binding protein [Christensenellales bacterium]
MPDNVLHIENLSMQFGGVLAVSSLNLDVNQDEIVALIGPNGAGKTTVFNMVTGVYTPTNGRIAFKGKTIAEGCPQGPMKKLYSGDQAGKYDKIISSTPDRITALGIARTFQNIRLFKEMTVFDNVLVATHMHLRASLFSAALGLARAEERRVRKEAADLIDLMGLGPHKDELAASLPYGKQRHLEILRALATKPHLLLLDEPAAGMNPQETDELSAFIYRARAALKLTVLLIEHQMNLVMDISDRIYVIDFGRLIAQGNPAQVQDNPDVITAYLGVEEA